MQGAKPSLDVSVVVIPLDEEESLRELKALALTVCFRA